LKISSFYIPNKTAIEVYSKYFKIINDKYYNYPNSDIILLGDFNIPSAISTNTKNSFFDNISFLNMFQFNNICNSKNDILDYVISNNNSINVILNKFPVVNVDLYHPPLEISCVVSLLKIKDLKYNEIVYDWEKANYYQIHLSMASINWLDIFLENNIESNISLF